MVDSFDINPVLPAVEIFSLIAMDCPCALMYLFLTVESIASKLIMRSHIPEEEGKLHSSQ